ncbi:MAG: DUF58 domain-containing protein [Amaricoccus sp.]|uniref:DUF58 domain-containing protein n=1 Tax=Amaricoccus sp. TaxID=1872485 RepID=UPI0039E6B5B9
MPSAARQTDDPALDVTPERLLALRRHLRSGVGGRWHPDLRPAGFPGRRRGAGLETIDVRPFVEGDDVRYLDRNVTARTGTPHVRSFREERGATVLLVADFRAAMLWGTRRALRSVAAAEALALGGWRALEAEGRVGALALAAGEMRYVPPRGRLAGMAAVAGGLAAAHAAALASAGAPGRAPEPALDRLLEAAVGLAPRGTSFVLATALDDPGREFEALAGSLGRAGRLKLLLVQDAFELAPPAGTYAYADGRGRHVGRPEPAADRRDGLARLGIPAMAVDVRAEGDALARAWDLFDGWR